VRHHAQTVLLRAADVGLAVAGMRVAAEPVLGVAHAVLRHLGEVVIGQAWLEHDRARVDLHAVGTEVLEAFRGRDGERLGRRRIVRPPRRVDALARGDDGRDPAVHVRVEKVDRLLPRCVVAEHHVTVRVDEAGDDGGAATVDDDVGARGVGPAGRAQRRDAAVFGQQRFCVAARGRELTGDERPDVDDT
jgi:hypothetical protein